MRPTLYDVLGAEPDTSADALHEAYRSRARAMHPDHGGGTGCTAGMVAVNAAWETLRDPALRTAYDRTLAPKRPPVPPHSRGSSMLVVTGREVRMMRGLIVAAIFVLSAVMAVFTVIAFAQSG